MNLHASSNLCALALLSAVAAAPAEACSYAKYFWPWEETMARNRAAEDFVHRDEYPFVFLARVKAVQVTPMGDGLRERIEFSVLGALKGEVHKTVTAVRVATNSTCGDATPSNVGALVLVHAEPIAGSSDVTPMIVNGEFARSVLAVYARKGIKPTPPR